LNDGTNPLKHSVEPNTAKIYDLLTLGEVKLDTPDRKRLALSHLFNIGQACGAIVRITTRTGIKAQWRFSL
jgi:hypothetical protein